MIGDSERSRTGSEPSWLLGHTQRILLELSTIFYFFARNAAIPLVQQYIYHLVARKHNLTRALAASSGSHSNQAGSDNTAVAERSTTFNGSSISGGQSEIIGYPTDDGSESRVDDTWTESSLLTPSVLILHSTVGQYYGECANIDRLRKFIRKPVTRHNQAT